MTIIDGRETTKKIRAKLKEKVKAIKSQYSKVPGLAVIIIGDDAASKIYVSNKIKACEDTGIKSKSFELSSDVTQDYVLELIDSLNNDKEINGILVQLPLPKHLDESAILSKIDVAKDVDGFSAYQMGKLVLGEKSLVACTPSGIMELLNEYSIDLAGKEAVIIGRSNIVGKPMGHLLMKKNATVTTCHSRTQNLKAHTLRADIIVAALGSAKFLKADMVKEGAVVIDVGINREEGKLCGDVDFDNVAPKCSYITPVPGGVGPMTITMLLKNTVEAFLACYEG